MREEIDIVLGSRTEVNNDDLANLEYVECVFKESMRKFPPVAFMHRTTTEDVVINGYKIPKNTWISVYFYLKTKNLN
jgi:cytochrome P450